MWSLGILLYVMLQGNYPFRAKTEGELFERIKQGRFEYIYNDISGRAKSLIEAMLRVNPLERLKVRDLLAEGYLEWYDQV
jgi:serine/threonine protein kinase